MALSPFPGASRRPLAWRGITDRDGAVIEVLPEDIAYYVHCQSGMTPMEFVAWLTDQLVTLEAIDPECSK